MSHANNGTSDLNAWVGIFGEFCKLMGIQADAGTLFEKLYTHSLKGDADCGGLLAYGYYSGENITMINEGRLAFLRTAESRFNLANFMKSHLYTSLGAVKMGMDILMEEENVKIDRITGHGGFFKTKGVGQRYLAAAVNTPVTVMDTASRRRRMGNCPSCGISDRQRAAGKAGGLSGEQNFSRDCPEKRYVRMRQKIEGFKVFMDRYKRGLDIEKCAIEVMNW